MQYNSTRRGLLGMTLKPRWVHPLNFREQDKTIMDAAILLAQREGSDLTNVIRDALKMYTAAKLQDQVVILPKVDQRGANHKTGCILSQCKLVRYPSP
jgi:hypothetical protein